MQRIKEKTLTNYKELKVEYEFVDSLTIEEMDLMLQFEVLKEKKELLKAQVTQLVLEQLDLEKDIIRLLCSHKPIRDNANPFLLKKVCI